MLVQELIQVLKTFDPLLEVGTVPNTKHRLHGLSVYEQTFFSPRSKQRDILTARAYSALKRAKDDVAEREKISEEYDKAIDLLPERDQPRKYLIIQTDGYGPVNKSSNLEDYVKHIEMYD